MGRIAARRADRLVLKETLRYLRGRSRASVLGELKAGAVEGGWRGPLPVYGSEAEALAGELDREPAGAEVLVLLSHAERDQLFAILATRGFEPIASATALGAIAR
jgi:uroporphyrinogen-III synthase